MDEILDDEVEVDDSLIIPHSQLHHKHIQLQLVIDEQQVQVLEQVELVEAQYSVL